MATRSCPECGAQYVATVRRCIDCDVVLVDEVAPEVEGEAAGSAVSTAAPVGAGEQVGYELEGWGNQLKVTLEGMLAKAGIGRVWEAGALVVAAEDEEIVDDLIATLEGDDLPELTDDIPRVALEIEGLDADGHAELDARLLAGSVPHAWDEDGALIVAEADEDRVLALVEEVLDGPPDEADGLAAQNALSALYVAVDRLAKNPHDRKLATAYVRAADGIDDLPVPYGFSGEDWDDLVAEAERLATALVPHADVVAPVPDAGDEDVDAAEPDDEAGDEDVEADAGDEADLDVAEPVDDEAVEVADADDEGVEDGAATGEADDHDGDADDAEGADAEDEGEVVSDLDADRAAARALRARLVDLV